MHVKYVLYQIFYCSSNYHTNKSNIHRTFKYNCCYSYDSQQSLFLKKIFLTHFNEIFVLAYKYTWKNTHTNIQPSKFAMITTLYLNCIFIYCNYLPLIYIITFIYYYYHSHTYVCVHRCSIQIQEHKHVQ